MVYSGPEHQHRVFKLLHGRGPDGESGGGVPADFLPGGGAGVSDHHDPDGGGTAGDHRRLEGVGLFQRRYRDEIRGLWTAGQHPWLRHRPRRGVDRDSLDYLHRLGNYLYVG